MHSIPLYPYYNHLHLFSPCPRRKEIDTLSGMRSAGSRRRQFSGSSLGGGGVAAVFANSNANDGSARAAAVAVVAPPESPVPSPKFR